MISSIYKSDQQASTTNGSVLLTGSSGLVGEALRLRLSLRGQSVTRVMRSAPANGQIKWDPKNGELDLGSLAPQAVVHLAGENIASGRWTKAKMNAIRSSRVDGTRLLCEQLAKLKQKPSVLVSASAIGFYGDRGEELLEEDSSKGTGFLSEVCEEWERATEPAREAGIRVVNLRIGVVLARDGGALAKMLLPFKLGLGGKLGSGRQWMSWISLRDLVSIICAAIDDERISGAINAVAPNAVRNLEFTKTLGGILHRPTIAAVPAFAARALLGRMADALLLASIRVAPAKLNELGFKFEHASLEPAIRYALGENT